MDEKTTLSKTEARQGRTTYARRVLATSTAAAVVALVVVYLVIL